MRNNGRAIHLLFAVACACTFVGCSDDGSDTASGATRAGDPLDDESGKSYAAWAEKWWASAAGTGALDDAAASCGDESGSFCKTTLGAGGGANVMNPLRLARFWALDRFFINGDRGVFTKPRLENTLLAKAQPDECFSYVGGPITTPPCTGESRPKVNDAYVWGLTKESSSLWFGTISNTQCLVESSYLGVSTPQLTDYWVCEFGASQSGTGDFRAPNMFRYDLASGTLETKNPTPGSAADLLRRSTVGLRSAGNAEGVVFLAGPSAAGGINMFAFDADTGALLGAHNFPEYSDIRSWVSARGALYTGVALTNVPDATSPGGRVLRWIGSKSTDPNVLFAFENVGDLDASAANLAVHQGRIVVSTWPTTLTATGAAQQRFSGLWRSPRLGADGLTPADAASWKKVWDIRDYEPDAIAAATTGGGALSSFKGRLYWGTMHVPILATTVALALQSSGQINLDANNNGTIDALELLNTALGTHRSISLFEADDLGDDTTPASIHILYGEKYLPTYSPTARAYTIAYDAAHRNRMPDPKPRWGSSGLGNFFNAYTWSMARFQESLYVGTFDWSQLLRVGLQAALGFDGESLMATSALGGIGLPERHHAYWAERSLLGVLNIALPHEGADLFRFKSPYRPAEAQSLTGVGNFTNYGVRTMVPDEDDLYVGTANPMNLHPQGGWELRDLHK